MIQEKIKVEILGRTYEIEIEGLTEIEANSLASLVGEKMMEIGQETRVVDTSRLAVIAALNFADEYRRLQIKYEDLLDAMRRRSSAIKKALEESLK